MKAATLASIILRLLRSEIWDRWQAWRADEFRSDVDLAGSLRQVFSVISPTGGIRPPDRRPWQTGAQSFLSERRFLGGLSMRRSLRSIGAPTWDDRPSTVSREVSRNGGADRYRAAGSDQAAWDRARRPKLCKLGLPPVLEANSINRAAATMVAGNK